MLDQEEDARLLIMFVGEKKKERKIQATLKNTWSQDLYKSYLDGNYLQDMSVWTVSTINLPAL